MLPKVPKGFITNFPNAVPDFIGPRQFIFLLSVVGIFLLVLSFFTDFGRLKPHTFPKSDIAFSSSSLEAKYNGYLNSAKSSTDQNQAFKYYQKAFFVLTGDYNRSPSIEKRESMENLADYIRSNYPEETQNMNLEIPCRERSCNAVFEYSQGLSEMRLEIEENESLNGELRHMLLLNLEVAALAAGQNNTDHEFNTLFSVFDALKAEWRRTENTELKLLAEKTLALMKVVDKSSYQASEEAGFFEL